MKKPKKNIIIRELEPLNPGRKRSLGEARRELRDTHRRRMALAREFGLTADDVDRLTADQLDHYLATVDVTHTPTEVPDQDESAS